MRTLRFTSLRGIKMRFEDLITSLELRRDMSKSKVYRQGVDDAIFLVNEFKQAFITEKETEYIEEAHKKAKELLEAKF